MDSSSMFINCNIQLEIDSYFYLFLDQQITLVVQARIIEAYQDFLKKLLDMLPYPVNPSILETPIVKTSIYGDNDPQFIDFMIPGCMVTIIFLLSISLTSLIFILEKKEGLLERTAVANVNTLELVGAHLTLKLLVLVLQTVLLLVISTFIFDVKMHGSIFLAGFLVVLQGFCGMSLGIISKFPLTLFKQLNLNRFT